MISRQPTFWQKGGIAAVLLAPASLIWLLAAALRRAACATARVDIPVICVGNIMSGGTGKTPIVAALAQAAASRGWTPVVLTRGHGGAGRGPILVGADCTADQVGDEAIWLARTCPVVISRSRAKGARYITSKALGDLIIMDDGMQNPALHKDRLLVVFNGRTGLGNGRIIPAGPMREPLAAGLSRADAVAISGEDQTGISQLVGTARPGMTIANVPRRLEEKSLAPIKGKPAIAFSGIGDNDGFFTMLDAAGVNLTDRVAFADHHRFSDAEIAALRSRAAAEGAVLVTTEKDKVRLGSRGEGINAVKLLVDIPDLLLDKILPRR